MKSASIFLIYLLLSVHSVHGAQLEDLLKAILDAKTPALATFKSDPRQLPASIIVDLDSRDDATVSAALIAYWLYGGESSTHVELIWWRSKSPFLRSLAAMLLLTGKTENTSNVPLLESSRFDDVERRQREEEIDLVKKNDRKLGAALKAIVEGTFASNPNEWKEALRLRFSGY